MPASTPASSPSRLPHHTAAQGTSSTSSTSSSPARAGPGAAHDSWIRNYESVEYEIPLLDPHGQLDSSDDEEQEVKKGSENISGGMHSQTDQPPPRTPPKNRSLSPKRDGNASAEPRLPRSPPSSHSRNASSSSMTTPRAPQYRNFSPPTPMVQALRASASASENDKDQGGVVSEGQIAARGGSGGASASASAGVSGSPRIPNTGSVMTDISHQSSLSSPTTTAVLPTTTPSPSTPTPTTIPPSSRSPRSSSFKSSPLAASVSVSSGANNNHNNNPTTTSGSNSSSLTSSTSAPAMNVSSSMSNPHSVGHSSSSSSTPPSSFFQSGQGSSSGQNLPSMPNTPYSQYAHGHPNPNSPPFAKPGTRPSHNMNLNNNNGTISHMNPAAYPQQPRINNDETRALVGPHGVEGGSGSGRTSPQSGFMPTALRDPPASMTNNHLYGHHPPGNANHPPLTSSGSRGSMILYRLSANEDGTLPPPGVPAGRRTSVYSNSGDSIVSLSGDSKYPLVGFGNGHGGSGTRTPGTPGRPGTPGTPNNGSIGNRGGELSMSEIGRVHGGLVAYMYDPGQDLDADELDEEEEEWVKMVGGHVPRSPRGGELKGFGSFGNANVRMDMSGKNGRKGQQGPTIRTSKHTPPPTGGIPWRGLINVSTLILLIIGLLALFLLYPVWRAYNNNGVEQLILGNTRINSTGQAVNEVVDPLNNREWRLPGFDRELQ